MGQREGEEEGGKCCGGYIPLVIDEEIFRLQVTVHDVARVKVVEPVEDARAVQAALVDADILDRTLIVEVQVCEEFATYASRFQRQMQQSYITSKTGALRGGEGNAQKKVAR
jgi:hypothetical protein